MNTALVLANAVTSSLLSLPSFDWNAGYVVGAIVAVGSVLVIALAIATPTVAIQRGATIFGTTFTILCIGLLTGALAGAAAGFYWGRQGDLKREQQVQFVTRVANQLDIYFEADPSATGTQKQAKNLQCTIVRYDVKGLESKAPGVTELKVPVKAPDAETFYATVEEQLRDWITSRKKVESDTKKPRVHLFMVPYPGNTIRERLRTFCDLNGCVLETTDSEWMSALDR